MSQTNKILFPVSPKPGQSFEQNYARVVKDYAQARSKPHGERAKSALSQFAETGKATLPKIHHLRDAEFGGPFYETPTTEMRPIVQAESIVSVTAEIAARDYHLFQRDQ